MLSPKWDIRIYISTLPGSGTSLRRRQKEWQRQDGEETVKCCLLGMTRLLHECSYSWQLWLPARSGTQNSIGDGECLPGPTPS